MTAALPMSLPARQLDALAAELDALRDRVRADLGERDARYIRAIYKAVRYTEFAGRATLMTLGWLPPSCPHRAVQLHGRGPAPPVTCSLEELPLCLQRLTARLPMVEAIGRLC